MADEDKCRQCGRTEADEYPDGQTTVLVGCDICGDLACDEHCALSEGEWCCTDHEPAALFTSSRPLENA